MPKYSPLLLSFLLAIPASNSAWAETPALQGFIGLNTVPSARMREAGTITAGSSTLDPYLHGYLGMQISDILYLQLRQRAEISDLNDDADRLYPGLDFKLKLLSEGAYHPEIALGVQSATGHKRMSGEYVALSKRYKDFDFIAGLGWGRFGSAGHIKNPLKILHSHFDSKRALDGEAPSTSENWFTGDHIGLFAGIEYTTPIDGLSIKADYGADRYSAELAANNYNRPAP